MSEYRNKNAPIRKWGIRGDSYFTREQVMAAYKLYQSGMSVPEITAQIWERLGYANHITCSRALWTLFRTHKLRTRSAGHVRWLHAKERICKGCGCHHDERTVGCRACLARHRARRLDADRRELELAEHRRRMKLCADCGCPNWEYSDGCGVCQDRRRKRERRAA